MKAFIRSLAGVVILLILAVTIIGFIYWARLPDMISNHLSKKMQVLVEIDDLAIYRKSLVFEKLEIGNLKGSVLPKSLSVESITVAAPLEMYFQNDIVIDSITMDNIYLGLEFDAATGTMGNWTRIMQNLENATPAPSEIQRKVLIKKLICTNIRVDLAFRIKKGSVRHLTPIDRLEFTNISSEDGLPLDQISETVLGYMLKEVFKRESVNDMLENVMKLGPKKFQQFSKPFQQIFKKPGSDTGS